MIKLIDLLNEIEDKDILKKNINDISKEITQHVLNKDELTLNHNLDLKTTNVLLKTKIQNIKSQKEYSITGQAHPGSRSISLNIKYNFLSPQIFSPQELSNEISITIWHEIRHIYQYIQRNQTKPEYKPQPRHIDYWLEQDEIEAHAEELHLKHELSQIPLEKVIQQFENELNKWLEKSIQQRIKGGFSEKEAIRMEGTKDDINNIISQIKIYLNKEYNLSL